ncbi:MAG TPA: hypothetical protein VN911_13180 [Candidatus Acidoferrum sp.]|nr:hypothetical protein [Candidatus Acidoferrum sp.]
MEQEQKHRSRLLGWLGAACALALICAVIPARLALAQSSTGAAGGTAKSTHPATVAHSRTVSTTSAHSKSKRRRKTARGQQKIDAERAQAIQEALIREHYLRGSAAGTWNQASEDAMRRYQADHGWQSKTVPDSRALISLGLGPSHDHLLNPESAMTTGPSAPRAASLTPASHSAEPGARMNVPPAATSDQNASAPQ